MRPCGEGTRGADDGSDHVRTGWGLGGGIGLPGSDKKTFMSKAQVQSGLIDNSDGCRASVSEEDAQRIAFHPDGDGSRARLSSGLAETLVSVKNGGKFCSICGQRLGGGQSAGLSAMCGGSVLICGSKNRRTVVAIEENARFRVAYTSRRAIARSDASAPDDLRIRELRFGCERQHH